MDAALPDMETVLDPAAMLEVLATNCLAPGGRFAALDCKIQHVRHKPGKNCLVQYDLRLRDQESGEAVQQHFCGRLYQPGESGARWSKATMQPLTSVPTGPAVVHVPQLSLVLWAFPNERKLQGLPLLLDAKRLEREILPAMFAEGGIGADGPVVLEGPSVVRYIPEHGCTVRLVVRVGGGSRTLYGKAYADETGARTFGLTKALGREVWYQAEHKLLWQAEVPGVLACVADLEPMAKALAALHCQPIAGLPEGGETVAAGLARAERLLAGRKEAAEVLAWLGQRTELTPESSEGLVVTVHGDMHMKNFLVAGGKAELIDLDTLRRGDPIAELGSFAASLYHRAALQRLDGTDEEEVDGLVERFVAVYQAHVPWQVSSRQLATQTARALVLERACRAITRRKGDVVASLLLTAKRLLQQTETAPEMMTRFAAEVEQRQGRRIEVDFRTYCKSKSWGKSFVTLALEQEGKIRVERFGHESAAWQFPNDPAMAFLPEAVDSQAVLAHLPLPAESVRVETLTYRPERRVTSRYHLRRQAQETVVYGKTYCNGHGLVVQERLQALTAAGMRMPEPLGYSPAIHTVWQAAYAGEALRERVLAGDERETELLLADAGAQLWALHSSNAPCPKRMLPEAQLADVQKKMRKVAVFLPWAAEQAQQLSERLAVLLPGLTPVAPRVVHGDCHIRQFMAKGNAVALFDFDELGFGDPVEDLGHFQADLFGDGFSVAKARQLGELFVRGYETEAGWVVPNDRLRWHTAVQLLTRAYRALLQLKPDLQERVRQHLRLAEEQL